MGSRIMGVVGRRKARSSEKSRARLSSSLCLQREDVNAIDSSPCEQAMEGGASERAASCQPVRSIRGCDGIQLRYHADDGMKGEAFGYVTADDRLFLATSSKLPLGTSVILDVSQWALSSNTETMTGKVTAVFPVADEFGFPAGIGISLAEGIHLLGGSVMSPGHIRKADKNEKEDS